VTMRVCSEPGCPELVTKGRCPEHSTAYELRRGKTSARGYGFRHQRLRARWAPKVAGGKVNCARCGERISPLEVWHLDHTDDRTGYLGPSHEACNVGARGGGVRPEVSDET
jgi:hypothetical protein